MLSAEQHILVSPSERQRLPPWAGLPDASTVVLGSNYLTKEAA